MVNHIVLWNFNETLTEEQKAEAGRRIKESLEAIKEKAQGVISLEVVSMNWHPVIRILPCFPLLSRLRL